MERKAFALSEIKASKDKPGQFEAVVAVFGNVDQGGDRIEKGAFARTLEERGLPPIVWSHMWDVPPIGAVQEAKETDRGLEIKGSLYVDDHEVARQVYAAMKGVDGNGRSPLREFSFGYEVRESTEEKTDGEDVRVLKDLELFEVGPTLVGMNPETELLAVKAGSVTITSAPEGTTVTTTGANTTSEVEDPQQDDNPEPNSEKDDEATATIRRLVAAHPIHLPPKEEQPA